MVILFLLQAYEMHSLFVVGFGNYKARVVAICEYDRKNLYTEHGRHEAGKELERKPK